jgi:speckle-type POZ protein
MAALLASGEGADVTFEVRGELMKAHRLILKARCPTLKGMLSSDMMEGAEVVRVDVLPLAFKVLLHFIYTDELPEVRPISQFGGFVVHY